MSNLNYKTSPFSRHFNHLKMLGAWVVEPNEFHFLSVYSFYKTVMTALAVFCCISLFCDLYLVSDDFKRVTWNLCISTLITGSLLKNIHTIHYSSIINGMRMRLHKDCSSKNTSEDDTLDQLSLRELRIIQVFFYSLAGIFVPTWLVTFYLGYFWSPKDMPIPLRLPVAIDTDDKMQYNLAFWTIGVIGLAGIVLVLETELAMFTLLIQISREYKRLLKDIPKLSELYVDDDAVSSGEGRVRSPEMNPLLREAKAKNLVKEYSRRQQKLIEYTEAFEVSYSFALLLQVFTMSVLVIVSAIQCLLEFGNFSNVSYQIGYLFTVVVDMFLVCWFTTRIQSQCLKVGEEVYSTVWYEMGSEIRREIFMIIMRSQRPPKITSGKLMEMNLHAFMLTMRNIYSWLTLFQQLALKTKE